MSILIGADLVPAKSNQQLFAAADAETLLGQELTDILKAADYRIFNLEVPLTDKTAPIAKCGPNLAAPENTVAGYKAIGADILTLANNHIMDQGLQGLETTCKVLEANQIAYLGVGDCVEKAAEPYFASFAGKKVGIYACAEQEFSIVTENTPGANPFDALESVDHVAALKARCDYVIVLYHGGKEYYRYPSPQLQKTCRKLVEKGADLVICQHSHCIGCEEKHQGGTIVYGQGNFLFDISDSEFFQTGLLVKLDDDFQVSYIPLEKKGNTVRLAQGDSAEDIMDGFAQRSQQICQPGFVEKSYREFAQKMLDVYLLAFSGLQKGVIFRALNLLTGRRYASWCVRRMYNKKDMLALRNYVECEAHRELMIEGLKERS